MSSDYQIKNNIKKLKEIFPEIFNIDGEIDIDILKKYLGIDSNVSETKLFGLNWFEKNKIYDTILDYPINANIVEDIEKSTNFDNPKNLYVESDNLVALKVMENHYNATFDVIYIDPPYNTGNDFIYNDNFSISNDEFKIMDNQINEGGSLKENIKNYSNRFHSDWLNMMYPRLVFARRLLKENGFIAISIDDNEFHNLKSICNEIFGEENFISNIVWQSTTGANDSKFLKETVEYILLYAKNINLLEFSKKQKDTVNDPSYKFKDEYFEKRGYYKLNSLDRASHTYSKGLDYVISFDGKEYYPGKSYENWLSRQQGNHATKDWRWMWSKEKVEWGLKNGYIVIDNNGVKHKIYQNVDNNDNIVDKTSSYPNLILVNEISNLKGTAEQKELFDNIKVFDHPKPIDLIKFIINLHPNKNANVLDFFSGSGTTGHATLSLNKEDGGNRKFVLIQIPEPIDNSYKTICNLAIERLKRAAKSLDEEDNLSLRTIKINLANFDNLNYSLEDNKESKYTKLFNFISWYGESLSIKITEFKDNLFILGNNKYLYINTHLDINQLNINLDEFINIIVNDSIFVSDSDKLDFITKLELKNVFIENIIFI